MLLIFECAPHIGIFCLTCCWKKFLVSGGLPADLQKYSKNEKFSLKNWKKCIFSILGGPNRLPGGWGGLGRLFGLPRGFTPNQCGSPQKKISDQAQPLPVQIDLSKSSIFAFFSPKKSNFWNCCRNFWQKVLPKFLATWWGPLTPEMSGDAVSWNFMYYSQSYEFLKIVKKCEKVLLFQRWEIPMNWYFKELLWGRDMKGHKYIYMWPDLFWVISFDVAMINTQIGFHSKAEMLVDNIWVWGPLA